MWLFPHVIHAAEEGLTFSKISQSPVAGIVNKIMGVVVIPILEGFFAFTLLVFIWGVVQLIRNSDDPKGREDGQRHMLWGIIGLAIMISAYGIIRVIANTVGVSDPFA